MGPERRRRTDRHNQPPSSTRLFASARAWTRRGGPTLERQLLADNVPACREFFKKYFDDRGYLQCFVRWGANDGPDDAFENFNHWPELHALGASDDILQMFLKGHEGLIKQYTEARTTDVPIARQGMYYKEFIVQSDWMHHGEGLQLFNRMGLSIPTDAKYQAARAAIRRVLHGRGSRSAELRPGAQDHPQHAERQPRADAAEGHGARLGRRSVRRQGIRRRCTANRRSSSSWRTTRNTATSSATTF